MVEHLSLESFMGGVLLGGIVTGIITYLAWGQGRIATNVQLLAAQANEAAAQTSEAATLIEAKQDREYDRAKYEEELAATRTAAARDREQDRAKYEEELAATRMAAARDREQDRAKYEEELSTAREGYDRARAEATWRSLSVGHTDWPDSLHTLTDGSLARKLD